MCFWRLCVVLNPDSGACLWAGRVSRLGILNNKSKNIWFRVNLVVWSLFRGGLVRIKAMFWGYYWHCLLLMTSWQVCRRIMWYRQRLWLFSWPGHYINCYGWNFAVPYPGREVITSKGYEVYEIYQIFVVVAMLRLLSALPRLLVRKVL